MSDKLILFRQMIKALLDGRKTQTRRIIRNRSPKPTMKVD